MEELWVVIHWDDGILYKGNDKDKALAIYEKAKATEMSMYEEENLKITGDEHIAIYKAIKSFRGFNQNDQAKFVEEIN